MQPKISVEGLAPLNRALRLVDKDAPKGLRIALNSAASLLAENVKPKIPSKSGAARRSLVARSTRTSARIALGGKKAPYLPWLDFGGEGRRPGRPAARPFIKGGRYVYPTLAAIRPKIEAQLQDAIMDVVRGAGLEVS